MRRKRTDGMDTFEELDDLLAVFGFNCAVSSSHDNGHMFEEDNSTDVVPDDIDISVDARVEQYLATQSIPAGQDSGPTTISAGDPDDPQNDLETIQCAMRNGCNCSRHCYNNFRESKVLDHVLNLREMERNEKEMYIMGTIDKVTSNVRCKDGERQRKRWEYAYEGKKVCRNAFLLIFDIGKRSLEGILKHMNEQGAVPRIYGLTGKPSNNALPKEVIKDTVQFLVNYAAEEGLPHPAPPRGRDGIPPLYLPASNTKLSIHKVYVNACLENDKRSVGLTTFKDVWNRCVPHIMIMNPREDVCKKCEDFRQEISLARNEEDKLSATGKYHQHVLDARSERAVYEQSVKESTDMFQQQLSMRNYNMVHYTFDFSQYLKLPHHSREKSPTFFIQPRKIQLFGFRIDGYRQYNYLVDENQTIGQDGQLAHGPDSVISMLDDAFEKFGMKEDDCRIHADNCFGQNKNRYILGYFSWRTMTCRHKSITYMMQLPGHTRCLIDAGFGRIKQLYRRSDVDTVEHAGEVVTRSSHSNDAVMYGNGNWTWRQWKLFLADRFKKVPNIAKYHSFRFTADEPGVVYMKVSSMDEAEVRFVVCKTHLLEMDPSGIPQELPVGGLSSERQRYLYRHVRPLVRQQYRDSFCLPPTSIE